MMRLASLLFMLVPRVDAFASSQPEECDVEAAFFRLSANHVAAEATCDPQLTVDCCWDPNGEATIYEASAPVAKLTTFSSFQFFKNYWFPVAFDNCNLGSEAIEFNVFNWSLSRGRVVQAGFYPNRTKAFHHITLFDILPGCEARFGDQHHYVYTPGEFPATETEEDYNPLSRRLR